MKESDLEPSFMRQWKKSVAISVISCTALGIFAFLMDRFYGTDFFRERRWLRILMMVGIFATLLPNKKLHDQTGLSYWTLDLWQDSTMMVLSILYTIEFFLLGKYVFYTINH
ncbi:hypothetical protein ACVS9P_11030 [Caproicibacterium sp. NSD3]